MTNRKTAENVEKVAKEVRALADSMKGNFSFEVFEEKVWEEIDWEGVMSEKALRILISNVSVEFDEADYEKNTGIDLTKLPRYTKSVKLQGLEWGNRNESKE